MSTYPRTARKLKLNRVSRSAAAAAPTIGEKAILERRYRPATSTTNDAIVAPIISRSACCPNNDRNAPKATLSGCSVGAAYTWKEMCCRCSASRPHSSA
jgi:hypothetical protein